MSDKRTITEKDITRLRKELKRREAVRAAESGLPDRRGTATITFSFDIEWSVDTVRLPEQFPYHVAGQDGQLGMRALWAADAAIAESGATVDRKSATFNIDRGPDLEVRRVDSPGPAQTIGSLA